LVLLELRSIVPATVVRPATTAISELTLEWVEAGQTKRVVIAENQPTKNPGTFRIGRDPATCDLVLSKILGLKPRPFRTAFLGLEYSV
jgi:hypothetical protein